MDNKEFLEKYESLKKSKFRQQKLLGWRPVPTLSCVTIIFVSFAVFFILVGILILVFTSQVKEVIARYDRVRTYENETDPYCRNDKEVPDLCSFSVPEKMKKPIMIYYQVDGFSQNHRAYMESKSDKQLKGETVSPEELKKQCEYGYLNDNEGAIPCGLMVKTYPDDKFKEWKIDGNEDISLKVEGIAYETDKEKYKKLGQDISPFSINVTEERFMIWMRPSPFKNPRKLWGIIDKNDIVSTVSFSVETGDHYLYENKRYLILSTRNVFGGKSSFLGLIYIIFGIICLATSIVFINLYHIFHKK
jgi:hypothetical protein